MDLTKLRALEMPTKEIEVEILGELQRTTIASLPDNVAVRVMAMREIHGDDPELATIVIREVLLAGAKELTPESLSTV